MKKVVCLLIVLVLSLPAATDTAAKESAKNVKSVAVLPFTTYGVENRGYTQQVITHVFVSPLIENSRIRLLFHDDIYDVLKSKEHEGLSVEEVYILGRRMGADFVIYGTVNQIGYNIGISAELIDIPGYRRKMAMSAVFHGIAEALPVLKAYARQFEQAIEGTP